MHEHDAVTSIDVEEFPRATSYIDFESVAALPFKLKVRWFLKELGKIAVPWDEGHLLLKIRREAVLGESMHLLMLVPAADLRQRLRIEFIDEPGLDAGGLLREWVLLLCEQLFDESYGLFQRTHADQSGYWLNPNSREIHRDHLHCFQFVGRLLAKCLLEGQLMTVHLALPFSSTCLEYQFHSPTSNSWMLNSIGTLSGCATTMALKLSRSILLSSAKRVMARLSLTN